MSDAKIKDGIFFGL